MKTNEINTASLQARLVQSIDGHLIVSVFPMESVEPAFAVRAYTHTGYNFNARQRIELQGCPTFAELAGPMYDGPGMIRYEDSRSNAQISA